MFAVAFWIFLFLMGYLFQDFRTGLICLAVGTGLSIVAGCFRILASDDD